MPLLVRLLENDAPTLRLLGRNPFSEQPPTYVRVSLYRYRFSTPGERHKTGAHGCARALARMCSQYVATTRESRTRFPPEANPFWQENPFRQECLRQDGPLAAPQTVPKDQVPAAGESPAVGQYLRQECLRQKSSWRAGVPSAGRCPRQECLRRRSPCGGSPRGGQECLRQECLRQDGAFGLCLLNVKTKN